MAPWPRLVASAIAARILARTDSTRQMMFWLMLLMSIGATLLAAPEWVSIDPGHILLLCGLAVSGFFGQLAPNVHGALFCNGLGVTRGTVTGTLLADLVAGKRHELTDFLLATSGPNTLPPEPFLSIGVNARLLWGQRQAGLES